MTALLQNSNGVRKVRTPFYIANVVRVKYAGRMVDRREPVRPRPPLGLRGAPAASRKERLTTERIVDAAMSLMSRVGYDAVSMRSLARELGTGPASLYTYVANREELDQLVLERVVAEVPLPEPDPEQWQEQVKQLLRDILGAYRAHPGSARAAMGTIPTGEGGLVGAEGMVALCLAGGITPQAAAWFCDLVSLYVGAVAFEESIWTERENTTIAGEPADHEALDDQLTAYFESLPQDRFPLMRAFAHVMTTGDIGDRFEFGIDVMLSGLVAASERYRRDDDAEVLAAAKRDGQPGPS
jgi:AcrR family transcriptional regulator